MERVRQAEGNEEGTGTAQHAQATSTEIGEVSLASRYSRSRVFCRLRGFIYPNIPDLAYFTLKFSEAAGAECR